MPEGVAVDHHGNVFVADTGNNRVRKIDSQGNVTTFAGNGSEGFADGTGGVAGVAEFTQPDGLTLDSDGNVVVADTWNNAIRTIDAAGNVTTVARFQSPTTLFDPNAPLASSFVARPYSVASAANGDLYFVGNDGVIL